MSTNRDYGKIISALKAKANAKGVTPQEKKTLERKIAELEKKHGKNPYHPFKIKVVERPIVPEWVNRSDEYEELLIQFRRTFVDTDDIIEEEWQEQGDDEPW